MLDEVDRRERPESVFYSVGAVCARVAS